MFRSRPTVRHLLSARHLMPLHHIMTVTVDLPLRLTRPRRLPWPGEVGPRASAQRHPPTRPPHRSILRRRQPSRRRLHSTRPLRLNTRRPRRSIRLPVQRWAAHQGLEGRARAVLPHLVAVACRTSPLGSVKPFLHPLSSAVAIVGATLIHQITSLINRSIIPSLLHSKTVHLSIRAYAKNDPRIKVTDESHLRECQSGACEDSRSVVCPAACIVQPRTYPCENLS